MVHSENGPNLAHSTMWLMIISQFVVFVFVFKGPISPITEGKENMNSVPGRRIDFKS